MPRHKGRPQQQESSSRSDSSSSSEDANEATEAPSHEEKTYERNPGRHEPSTTHNRISEDAHEQKGSFNPPRREMKNAAKQSSTRHEASTSLPSVSSDDSSSEDSDDSDLGKNYFVDFLHSMIAESHSHRARSKPQIEEAKVAQVGNLGKVLPTENHKISVGNGKDDYLCQLGHLQVELNKLQAWVVKKGLKVAVIFEGRDAAGKGGAIQAIAETLNPRVCRVVALTAPTEREKSQWYFQRYSVHLPAAGEIVLFDRSWYNRAGVERVMGFCSEEEYQSFLRDCPTFEKMLVDSGVLLRKYWLDISQDVQDERLQRRIRNPTKHWKLSPMDLASRTHWTEYTCARDHMFQTTHRPEQGAAWHVVAARSKVLSRLNLIRHLLDSIDYSVVPDELPRSLEPVEKCDHEVDICQVDKPTTYIVIPSVYHNNSTVKLKDAAFEMLTFGKYGGKTYGEVLESDPSYCSWALGRADPSPELARFAEFVRRSRGCDSAGECLS